MRRPKQLELYSIERDFIAYLKDEVTFWRSEYSFLKGKVERLELSINSFGSQPAREYVQRTDKPIEAVPVQTEEKPLNRRAALGAMQAKWDAMTPEEQDKALGGAN